MSLILDALNKADGERNTNDLPSLNSNHDFRGLHHVSNSTKRMIYILSGFVFLLSCFVLYLILTRAPQDAQASKLPPHTASSALASAPQPAEKSAAASVSETQSRTISTAPAAVKEAQSGSNNAPVAAPKSQQKQALTVSQTENDAAKRREKLIAEQYQQAQREEEQERTTRASAAVKTPKSMAQNNPAAAPITEDVSAIYQNLDQEQSQESSQTLARKAVQAPAKQAQAAPAATSNTLAQFPTLKFINDLPYAQQNAIPSIMYSSHNFSSSPASVTLNNTTRRKGEAAAENVIIEEIVADGIVLRHNDTRFKMYALSSWINM